MAARHRGEPYAIVLLDLAMPDTDGREVAAAIKATSPVTPIVLGTGSCDCLQADNQAPAHVERVLSKPPNVEDLRRAIVELTARPKPTYSHIGR